MVIVDRIVQHRPIVPECYAAHSPLEAAGILWPHLVLMEPLQKRCALFGGPAIEAIRMSNIDVEAFLSSLWVRADGWVVRYKLFLRNAASLDSVFSCLGRVRFRGRVNCRQLLKLTFQAGR